MRAVVQRVSRARATPGGEIGRGVCALLGVARGDGEEEAVRLAGKVARLRIFADDDPPEHAKPLYLRFCDELRALWVPVETGVFGAQMQLELVNDGPVTIV